MVFSSTVFLFIFFPLVVSLYHSPWFKSQKSKNGLLLLASLGFYAWGEPVFIFLMILSIIVTWMMGLLINTYSSRKKLILTIAVIYHIAILFVFKYLGFVLQQAGSLLFHTEIRWSMGLPIGISFFTFQMLSYLFDVYYKKAGVQKDIFKLALYVSFFPQLIAGPIVRYEQIEREIDDRTVTKTDLTEGIERFSYGLAKKILLSDRLAFIADTAFAAGERSVAAAWLGGICYGLQIYFDFSGYSDMAIGAGRSFGFHFSENFDYPYTAKSVTEFWRRWHISLGTWFRDYVYIPLGGNRVSKKRWVLNIFTVWTLTGIWHGADWTFLLWGTLYFCLLLMEKLTVSTKRSGIAPHLYTIATVTIAWVVFRSDNISSALVYIGNMFGIQSAGLTDALFIEMAKNGAFVIIAGCLLSFPVYKKLLEMTQKHAGDLDLILRSAVCITAFVLSVIQAVASTYSPFIYFNF